MKKKILLMLMVLLCALGMLASCGKKEESKDSTKVTAVPTKAEPVNTVTTAPTTKPVEPVEAKVGFRVEGTKLIDAKGNEFVMRGVNHAHAWFKQKDAVALQAIAATGSNAVRIVCADGGQWSADSVGALNVLIEYCKNNKMICILEVHDATGSNKADDLLKAVDYWIGVKDAFIGNEDYVILNIANEWIGSWDENLWCTTYQTALTRLREAGLKNVIMIDAPGWGQYGDAILNKGAEVLEADPDGNTMFSVHMYGTAGGSQAKIKKVLQGALDKNLCICVGEFGYNHSDGDVDEGYIMQFCVENNIGYLAWSWKGNGGGVEYLDLSNDWEGNDLSKDWGEVLVNGENGIKATSKLCTVFEQ